MKLVLLRALSESLPRSAPQVQKAFLKQSQFLLHDLHHPSLRAKKFDEALGIWQARVNRGWRFYFTIETSEYRMQALVPHPK